MSILFITAFKDIDRKSWKVIPRTNEKYIGDFLNLANNIKYRLIVFVENPIMEILLTKNIPSNIVLLNSSLVTTFYDRFGQKEDEIMQSEIYKQKIPDYRKDCPEHWNAKYTMVNHSKINYVAYCKKQYPQYEYYSWLDFGFVRESIDHVPKNINFSKLDKKIHYLYYNEPTTAISANEMLSKNDIYFIGSFFVVYCDLIDQFEQLYEAKLLQWQEETLCDDDQNLLFQLYFENRDLFKLFPSHKQWFTLFSNHLNSSTPSELLFNEKIATPLCEIMGRNRSDKGSLDITNCHHNYTTFYYSIFKNLQNNPLHIFELGLGTTNQNIPSHMEPNGRPGASLYGWAEFFKNATVYGADIDRDILFQTDRIHTHFCDQTKPHIIQQLWEHAELQQLFDIIIEDGLHEYSANVCFFENSIHKLAPNGYFIIEDILNKDIPKFTAIIEQWKVRYPDLIFTILPIPSTKNLSDNTLIVIKRV